MEIPDGISNISNKANTLEIFGSIQFEDVDHGRSIMSNVLPTIKIYERNNDTLKIVKEYYLRNKVQIDNALKEILRANSLQDTLRTTQNSGQQDITDILNKMLSLVERIESNTRPTPN
jgi:predicted RNA binding protein with dsRBD fold (UPF0201 family)